MADKAMAADYPQACGDKELHDAVSSPRLCRRPSLASQTNHIAAANGCHRTNLFLTSSGTRAGSKLLGWSRLRATQTRVSIHSTASTSSFMSLCCTTKLLFPHSLTQDSTTTSSPNVDDFMKRVLTSTTGMPAIWKVSSISCFLNPARSNNAIVQASKYSKYLGK